MGCVAAQERDASVDAASASGDAEAEQQAIAQPVASEDPESTRSGQWAKNELVSHPFVVPKIRKSRRL
jgi:hypothetical protein